MIAYIKGKVVHKDSDSLVLDNQGMGYLIKVPSSVAERVSMEETVTIYTYMYVREDQLSLYGFLKKEELLVFEKLLGINGIGPKAALSVLSTLTVEELYFAVFSEDIKAISKTPGIGPKGAKRMVMELKDKLCMEDLDSMEGMASIEDPGSGAGLDEAEEAAQALIALGYGSGEAYRAVRSVEGDADMTSEQWLKAALKYLL